MCGVPRGTDRCLCRPPQVWLAQILTSKISFGDVRWISFKRALLCILVSAIATGLGVVHSAIPAVLP